MSDPYSIHVPTDTEFGAARMIGYDDALSHHGDMYMFQQRYESQSAVLVSHIRVGANPCHAATVASASGKVTADVIEGVTITSLGTPVVLRNRNRTKPDDGLLARSYIGSDYTGGTVIRRNQVGYGTNPGTAQSSTMSSSLDIVLRPNTDYVLLLTPAATADISLSYELWEAV